MLVGLCLAGDLALGNRPNESTALPPAHYDVLRADTNNETISLLRQRLTEAAGPDRIDRVELAAVGFERDGRGPLTASDAPRQGDVPLSGGTPAIDEETFVHH